MISSTWRALVSIKLLISKNLKSIRLKAGLSQQRLSERSGLQVRYLSELENHPRDISTRTLERLAAGLGVSPVTLLAGVEAEIIKDVKLPKKLGPGLKEAIKLLKVHAERLE